MPTYGQDGESFGRVPQSKATERPQVWIPAMPGPPLGSLSQWGSLGSMPWMPSEDCLAARAGGRQALLFSSACAWLPRGVAARGAGPLPLRRDQTAAPLPPRRDRVRTPRPVPRPERRSRSKPARACLCPRRLASTPPWVEYRTKLHRRPLRSQGRSRSWPQARRCKSWTRSRAGLSEPCQPRTHSPTHLRLDPDL